MASGLSSPWDASHLQSNFSNFIPQSGCGGTSGVADTAEKGDFQHHVLGNLFGHDWENAQNIALVAIESICALVLFYCIASVKKLVWKHKGEVDKLRTNSLRGAIWSTIISVLVAIAFIVVNQVYVCVVKSANVVTYAIFGLSFRTAEVVVAAVVARTVVEQLQVVGFLEKTTNTLSSAFSGSLYVVVAPAVASYVMYMLWLVKLYGQTHIPYSADHFGEIAAKLDFGYRVGYAALTWSFLVTLTVSLFAGSLPTIKARKVLLLLITVPLAIRALEQVVVSALVTFSRSVAIHSASTIALADAIIYNIATPCLFLALIRLGKRELPTYEDPNSPSYLGDDMREYQVNTVQPLEDSRPYWPQDKPDVQATTYEYSDHNWR